MTYTDEQLDALLEKANEIGFNTALGIVRTLRTEDQEKYVVALRSALREILELLPEPEAGRLIYGVYCQPWWESERGWGHRPDGYSMHADKDARDAFIADYMKKNRQEKTVPDCYSYPDGEGYVIEVDRETYEAVHNENVNGIWGTPTFGRAPAPANRRDLEVGVTIL